MSEKDKRLTVVTDPELHRQLKVKSAQEGRGMSEVVRALLAKWLRGEVTLNNDGNDEEGQPLG